MKTMTSDVRIDARRVPLALETLAELEQAVRDVFFIGRTEAGAQNLYHAEGLEDFYPLNTFVSDTAHQEAVGMLFLAMGNTLTGAERRKLVEGAVRCYHIDADVLPF